VSSEPCFTACPYGLRYSKPGSISRTDEDSAGPSPGIDCPGAGSSGATPSTPTLQEPPPAERYARVPSDLVSRSSRGGGSGDGGWGQRGCRRRTTAGGAAEPGSGAGVRGCVACRRRPGPEGGLGGGHGVRGLGRVACRSRPGPQQVPGGSSTLGITHHLKDYGRTGQGPPRWRRRTWLAGLRHGET
jgi:hypothetical protein